MDSDSDEASLGECASTISSHELDSSSDDDNFQIEGLHQDSMDEWQWKIDNSHFSTSFSYFDRHALGKKTVRPIDSYVKR